MRARSLAAAAAALSLAGTALATTAVAAPSADKAQPETTVLAKKLFSPLSLAVDAEGTRYFSQNFAGLLMRQTPGGKPEVVYQAKKGAEVGAISVDGSVVTFAVSEGDNAKGTVYRMDAEGTVTRVAKLHTAEKALNPDGKVRYGFRNLAASCAKKVKGIPVSYAGVVETHPYATASSGGTTYVADAGANAVFAIDEAGEVSAVGAVPAARVVVSKQAAKAFDLPACVVGKAYYFEAVPTDVEVGPDGKLYVTSLPGGPEDPILGANGAVFKIKPGNGRAKKVVRGLVSASGVAVAENGDLFVAELFSGRIVRVKAGSTKVKTYVEAPLPSAVEIGDDGRMYATVSSLVGLEPGQKPKGQLVQIGS
jgi:hypothetical protein